MNKKLNTDRLVIFMETVFIKWNEKKMTSNVPGGGSGGNIVLTNIDLMEETVVDEANDIEVMTTAAIDDQAVYTSSSSSSNFSINDNGASPCFVAVHIGINI